MSKTFRSAMLQRITNSHAFSGFNRMLTKLLVSICAAFVLIGTAHADSVIGNFNLLEDGTQIASVGEISLALNGNGTITASATSYYSALIGIGINTLGDAPESDFSPTQPDNMFGWGSTGGGLYATGFLCTSCGNTLTWTIGNPGGYSSISQFINGTAPYTFFLYTDGAEYFANAVAVPEPASLALMPVGLIVLGIAVRRNRILGAQSQFA